MAFCACVILSLQSYNRYETKNTVVTIEKDHYYWNTSMPSITICPTVNRISPKKFDDYCECVINEKKRFNLGSVNWIYISGRKKSRAQIKKNLRNLSSLWRIRLTQTLRTLKSFRALRYGMVTFRENCNLSSVLPFVILFQPEYWFKYIKTDFPFL